jgi:flagellar basal body-associated protein FliL
VRCPRGQRLRFRTRHGLLRDAVDDRPEIIRHNIPRWCLNRQPQHTKTLLGRETLEKLNEMIRDLLDSRGIEDIARISQR